MLIPLEAWKPLEAGAVGIETVAPVEKTGLNWCGDINLHRKSEIYICTDTNLYRDRVNLSPYIQQFKAAQMPIVDTGTDTDLFRYIH